MSYQTQYSRSKEQGSRSSYGRNNSNRNRNFGRRKGNNLDHRRFIKKAKILTETEQYVPKHSFSTFGFTPELTNNLVKRGYVNPTPIQDQAIPSGLAGLDVLGIASTGTGKTAAFLLPLIERVLKNPQTETILIIAPVRELAQQIEAELAIFTQGLHIGYMTAIGGTPIGPQLQKLRATPHFIIGTPGRITDLMERRVLPLKYISAIVLDEVDRMLDMGFIDTVKAILKALPIERQSLFFSATISPDIATLIQSFMNNPITVRVKAEETADNIEQDVVRIGYGMQKIDVLHELLILPEMQKVLIFGETKMGVERLAKNLHERGFKTEAIHGNKNQTQRSRAITNFDRGTANIMVATDVAARGLDIKGITHVINYDMPQTYDDYTHRIGRTGRAGQIGYALTFVEG